MKGPIRMRRLRLGVFSSGPAGGPHSKLFHGPHVVVEASNEYIIVVRTRDLQEGLVRRRTGMIKGFALGKGDDVVVLCMDDQSRFIPGLDLIKVSESFLFFENRSPQG
jgi:hypothetical protein